MTARGPRVPSDRIRLGCMVTMAAVALSFLLGAAIAKRDEPPFAEGRLWRIS